MATQVTKSDGNQEPFDANKIKKAITAASQEAGLPTEETDRVVSQVFAAIFQLAAGKEEVTTRELRDRALAELDRVSPPAAAAWRKYDEARGKG